jgi:hypothetical protein
MQVYSNIVRFPAPEPAPAPLSHRAALSERTDNVVAFAPDKSEPDRTMPRLDLSAQHHGQLHLAHRMSARAIAEFEAVAAL